MQNQTRRALRMAIQDSVRSAIKNKDSEDMIVMLIEADPATRASGSGAEVVLVPWRATGARSLRLTLCLR